jgi:hypothetical protein
MESLRFRSTQETAAGGHSFHSPIVHAAFAGEVDVVASAAEYVGIAQVT